MTDAWPLLSKLNWCSILANMSGIVGSALLAWSAIRLLTVQKFLNEVTGLLLATRKTSHPLIAERKARLDRLAEDARADLVAWTPADSWRAGVGVALTVLSDLIPIIVELATKAK
jgi:hypothetical protein